MAQSGTLWSDRRPADASGSVYYKILIRELENSGVVPCASASVNLRFHVEQAGESGVRELRHLNCPSLESPASARRFGWGFVFTGFLIAPSGAIDTYLCSLGALSNLMIVTCDDLIDSGVPVHSVLPEHQRESGGDASAVMLLLQHYLQAASELLLTPNLCRTMKKVIANMFDAEARTVTSPGALPYLFWLRKCSLPLVLMALPAFHAGRAQHYLSWIYRVGRFLGVVDDALDLQNDSLHNQPNCLLPLSEPDRLSLIGRTAAWGVSCMREWDALVPSNSHTILAREAFLQTIWGW